MSTSPASGAVWPEPSQLLAALSRWLDADLKGREDRLLARLLRRVLRCDVVIVEVGSLDLPERWLVRARLGARAQRLASDLAALAPDSPRRPVLDRIVLDRVSARRLGPLEAAIRRSARHAMLRLPLRDAELGDRVVFLIDPPEADPSRVEACAQALEMMLRAAARQRRMHRLGAESTALRRENLVLTEQQLVQRSELSRERALQRLSHELERSPARPEELLRCSGRALAEGLGLSMLLLIRGQRGELHALLPQGQPEFSAFALIRNALLRNRLGAPEDFRLQLTRESVLHPLVENELRGMATVLSDGFEHGDRLLAISLRRAAFGEVEKQFVQRAAELLLRRLRDGEREEMLARHAHELERRFDLLSASYRIARTLAESENGEIAAAQILRDVRATFHADAAILVQTEADHDALGAYESSEVEDGSLLAFAFAQYEQRFGVPGRPEVEVRSVSSSGHKGAPRRLDFAPGPLDAARWPDAIVASLRLPQGEAGVLCLLARDAQTFTADSETALRVLAGDAAETLGHLHGRAVRERRMLEDLVAQLPTAVIVVGADRAIRVLNRAAATLLGIGGRSPRTLRELEKRTGLEFSLLLPEAGDAAASSQDVVWGAEGARHLRIDVGSLEGDEHVFVLRDVTRRKRLELEQAEFVGSVSHELKTPLTALRTALEIILQGEAGLVTEEQAHFLEMGRRNIDRLGRLIQQLLDVARHDSGRLELARVAMDVGDLLTPHLESFARHARRESRALRWELQERAIARVDPDRFVEILENLLGNALKFTEAGGHIDVRLQRSIACPNAEMNAFAERLGLRLRGSLLEVRDDGRGMDAASAERAFRSFYQGGDPLASRPQGAGLGLAIVRALVAAHEGTIELESEPGRGTCVRVWIPEDESSGALPATFERLGFALREAQSRLRRGRLIALREQAAGELRRAWVSAGLDPARLGAPVGDWSFGLVLEEEWRAPLRRALSDVAEWGGDLLLPGRRVELGTLLAQLLPAEVAFSTSDGSLGGSRWSIEPTS